MRREITVRERLASLPQAVPIGEIVLPDALRNDRCAYADNESIRIYCTTNDLWLVQRTRAKHIVLSDYRRFEVGFMTPAKSGGFVSILAAPATEDGGYASMLDFGMYSDTALATAKRIAAELESVLGYRIQSTDWGPDC